MNILDLPNLILTLILILLEIILLITAWLITTRQSIRKVIAAYRYQSLLLATVTLIAALNAIVSKKAGVTELFVFSLLPILLALIIEPLLMLATVIAPGLRFWPTKKDRLVAEQIWLKQEEKNDPLAILFFIGSLTLAVWIAFIAIAQFDILERIGLMVSLTLHLIGLYNTAVKRNIISQVVGLLTIDHGFYLATINIVAVPVPAGIFVLALFFYTFITFAILLFLVPQVRYHIKSIDLDKIAEESDLEG